MACMTLIAQPMTMTTTQLARAIRYDEVFTRQMESNLVQDLRMSWVVVTDGNGNRKLQIEWARSADGR